MAETQHGRMGSVERRVEGIAGMSAAIHELRRIEHETIQIPLWHNYMSSQVDKRFEMLTDRRRLRPTEGR